MLIKAQNQITRISEDSQINQQNYMDSLSYVSTLYLFINKLKTVVTAESVEFLPTFYGQNACMLMKIDRSGKETEMKVLKVKSPLFLVDAEAKKVGKKMESICEEINVENDIMTFILR